MAKKRTTVNAHRAAAEPLEQLQAALREEFGVAATREDIVGALIFGATAPQLLGMHMAFIRHVESRAQTQDRQREDVSGPAST